MIVDSKPVPGFPGYFALKSGEIVSVRKLKPSLDRDGYEKIVLYKPNGDRHALKAHRIIAVSWIGPAPDGFTVNHKNGKRRDNTPENLEWMSRGDNERHARRVLGKSLRGERCSRSKLKDDDIRAIRDRALQGWTHKKIGEMFDVGTAQISRIVSRENWGHIE